MEGLKDKEDNTMETRSVEESSAALSSLFDSSMARDLGLQRVNFSTVCPLFKTNKREREAAQREKRKIG